MPAGSFKLGAFAGITNLVVVLSVFGMTHWLKTYHDDWLIAWGIAAPRAEVMMTSAGRYLGLDLASTFAASILTALVIAGWHHRLAPQFGINALSFLCLVVAGIQFFVAMHLDLGVLTVSNLFVVVLIWSLLLAVAYGVIGNLTVGTKKIARNGNKK